MIESTRGLSSDQLVEISELEARTVAADGGRLKLEWGTLRTRDEDQIRDILYWDGSRLIGFLGLYAFGSAPVEVTAMVDPNSRRRGVATELLDAALALCRERNHHEILLVTPRTTEAGRYFALARGAVLDHSEHALALTGRPTDGPTNPQITLRAATPDDSAEVARLLTTAFGWPHPDAPNSLDNTMIIDLDDAPVGTLRIEKHADTAGIYGFAVDPVWQGRGIGRYVLRRTCQQLREDGYTRIGLEVAVDNDHALGLYTSLGFSRVSTEDYYALTV